MSADDTLLTVLALFLEREDLITILEAHGGRHLYLPTLRSFLRSERECQIIRDWRDGASYKEVARKHGVCVRTVRRIVHEGRPNTP